MMFLLGIALFTQAAVSSDVETATTSWHSATNERSTWDLISSCVLTLTICVWSALHLNVPTENSTRTQRNLRRARWIVLGIFAPELVVSSAFAQYLTAKWLLREIQKDAKHRNDPTPGAEHQLKQWTLTTCHFAVMGGITVEASECLGGGARLSLTSEGVRLLSFLGHLPQVQESHIRDKSKADGLGKTLVCLQAGWMILQTIARVHQDLTITLLEINTIGHVLCALLIYGLWWNKPLEVKDPIIIAREEWMDPYLSFMWMCSPISGSDDDEITEMRCMAYIPQAQRACTHDQLVSATTVEEMEAPTPLIPHETHFSIGSKARRDPVKFIGPLGEFNVGIQSRSTFPTPFDHRVSYKIGEKGLKTAPEHEVFIEIQEPHHGLQHSLQYCRRAFTDCKDHDPLPESAIKRWRNACLMVDKLWQQCEERPDYRGIYFTTSTLGKFVGEKTYIDTHMRNFLRLSYLGSGNVSQHLVTVLAFAGSAYGGLHLAAWNDYFPTKVERILWITSSIAICSSWIMLWLFFLIKKIIKKMTTIQSRLNKVRSLATFGKYAIMPMFVLARAYLVVEAFVSLRRVPLEVYQTPEWSEYFPHL
ncbi:hypothetical protein B0J11DRAFT_17099 [Dendryphion nanum]|uniref:Uncharacterized protein n=1 Tax=Dendryphion nanum TaxID=256645 RepID=A0A9P9IYI8_9PLEO|nr:hypothetical protein B0J11DRAFT_17099 [Dendryphion nanum]